jgi:hypothetical protein
VSDLTGDPANNLHVLVTLPAGAVLGSASSDRGSGCVAGATSGTLDCNLDYLSSASPVGNITIVLTLPNPGAATLTASASATQTESNTANNTASATVQVNQPGSGVLGTKTTKPAHCVVPKVTGKTLAAARKAISQAHCAVGRVGTKASTKSAKGKVLSQAPAKNRVLAKGAKVNLTVGKGRAAS